MNGGAPGVLTAPKTSGAANGKTNNRKVNENGGMQAPVGAPAAAAAAAAPLQQQQQQQVKPAAAAARGWGTVKGSADAGKDTEGAAPTPAEAARRKAEGFSLFS